jgi:hypothetical protein
MSAALRARNAMASLAEGMDGEWSTRAPRGRKASGKLALTLGMLRTVLAFSPVRPWLLLLLIRAVDVGSR